MTPETYLRYADALTSGLRSFQTDEGQRLLAAMILGFDAQADLARGGYLAAMPGHPEQAEDAADQCARDRLLIKFGNESLEDWKSYVQGVWTTYGRFQTTQGVLAAVNRWGEANYPSTWVTAVEADIAENNTEKSFTVNMPVLSGGYGQVNPWRYDTDSIRYDEDALYDIGASARVFTLLRRSVRQAKPARSKAYIAFPLTTDKPFSGSLFRSPVSNPADTRVTISGAAVSNVTSLTVTITSGGSRGIATFSVSYSISGVSQAPIAGTTAATNVLGATGLSIHFVNISSYTIGHGYAALEGFNFLNSYTVRA